MSNNNTTISNNSCGYCHNRIKRKNKNGDLNNNTIIKVPELSSSLIHDVQNKIIFPYYNNLSINNNSNNKLKLGVIKFSYNGKNYIHCPILKLDENNQIKFGVCKTFKSLENTFNNRQKLCAHKYRHHFKCDKLLSSNIHIKASQSIEDVLLNLIE